MRHKPVVLIIRDGWGINENPAHNAVAGARTPNVDRLLAAYPHTTLEASGEAVGLPRGYQGSSEVGHLNMGAGRIVRQEITRINEGFENGSFFESPVYLDTIGNCLERGTALHMMGLVQDEGVHAHIDHMLFIIRDAVGRGVKRVYIHFFGDGRDTPPRSALTWVGRIEREFGSSDVVRPGTVMGRYYSMDRSKNWALTSRAYHSLVRAEGRRAASIREAFTRAYETGRAPDGSEMTDEYVEPTVIGDYPGIKDGDSVIHFNYRQDRAVQLTMAFCDEAYPGVREVRPDIKYAGLTRYYDAFGFNIIGALDKDKGMDRLLGQVISELGLRQLRISETQKFRHVTSFFNGKRTAPYPGEDQVEIPSEFDASSFALHPEMNARDILRETLRRLGETAYDFVAVNFANCDMVGHTGNYASAVRAVETVDECVGALVEAVLGMGGVALVTADHGNAEQMMDYATGEPKTSHTVNPVHLIYAGADATGLRLDGPGILSDIAPTVLALMGVEIPPDMTARSLIVQR